MYPRYEIQKLSYCILNIYPEEIIFLWKQPHSTTEITPPILLALYEVNLYWIHGKSCSRINDQWNYYAYSKKGYKCFEKRSQKQWILRRHCLYNYHVRNLNQNSAKELSPKHWRRNKGSNSLSTEQCICCWWFIPLKAFMTIFTYLFIQSI